VAVLAAFLAGFGSLLAIIGEVTSTILTTFLARLRGALTVVSKVAAAVLATFFASLGSALWVVSEITTAVVAAFLTSVGSLFAIICEVTWISALIIRHEITPITLVVLKNWRLHYNRLTISEGNKLVRVRRKLQSTMNGYLKKQQAKRLQSKEEHAA
jgi:hypothetical protein